MTHDGLRHASRFPDDWAFGDGSGYGDAANSGAYFDGTGFGYGNYLAGGVCGDGTGSGGPIGNVPPEIAQ